MRNHIDAFIHETLLIEDTGELNRVFVKFLAKYGIDLIAYCYLAEGFKRVPQVKAFRLARFPEDFARYCWDNGCLDYDPLILEARRRGVPFHWFEIADDPGLSQLQKDFLEAVRKTGARDGLSLTVFVRPGDIAYFSLGSTTNELDFTRAQLLELQAVCQHMHLRYNELAVQSKTPKLSNRERQVLELIAQGMSNTNMGKALGVSPNTIDTLVRRCFEKLGVSSRVEAALAGIAMGIILP